MIFRRIASNLTSIMAARILFQVFNAVTQITIARMLGVELFGAFSTALALVNALLVANDIGMSTLMIKEGSRMREKLKFYLGNALLVQLGASVIFYIAALVIGYSLGYSFQILMLVVVLGLAYIAFEFRKPLRAVLRILLRLKRVAILEIICGFFIMAIVLGLAFSGLEPNTLLYLVVLVEFVAYVGLSTAIYAYMRNYEKPDFSQRKEIRDELKISWKYSFYNIMFILYLQISIIMVGAMAGPEQAGLYSAASKLVVLLFMVPQMIFQVALPLLFQYFKADRQKYDRVHRLIFKYLVALGFPVAAGMALLSGPIIALVYGPDGYGPSAQALQAFAVFVAFRFMGNVSGQSLTTSDRQNQENIIVLIYTVVLVALNYFTIPRFGFMGAVWTTVACEAMLRLTYMIVDFSHLRIRVWPYVKKAAPAVLSCLLMGVFVYFTRGFFNVIITIVLSAILYGFLLWTFRFFDKYDKSLFTQLITKNKT